MARDFAVVSFPNDGNNEEEIVSEVPVLWLRSNLTQCWWPSVKNINMTENARNKNTKYLLREKILSRRSKRCLTYYRLHLPPR